MKIMRELATDSMDLPHAYDAVGRGDVHCVCGRKAADKLHHAVLTEQAAHRAPLQTEKGTV